MTSLTHGCAKILKRASMFYNARWLSGRMGAPEGKDEVLDSKTGSKHVKLGRRGDVLQSNKRMLFIDVGANIGI